MDCSDSELLRIEIGTIWTIDERGRLNGLGEHGRPNGWDLVIGSSLAGCVAALGADVPNKVADALEVAVARAAPGGPLDSPPPVVEHCRQVLSEALGTVELSALSGPSFLIPESLPATDRGYSEVALVRSDGDRIAAVRDANPGNWDAEEWPQLVDGQLGPWVMATRDGDVVSMCHTPRLSARAAEAGVWTRPGFRGQGYAAAVTAEWASVIRPLGRYLFYSTSGTNASSQRVAARLGLRPIGWLWKLGRRAVA